jgi:hypothetical protein
MTSSIANRFYDQGGKPQYEIKCKGNPRKLRKPTIRDAREHGWIPSVTTVLKMLSKPSLEYWKTQQLLESALTHPFIGSKEYKVDDLIQEIIFEAGHISRTAMDLGTQYHDEIEALMRCFQHSKRPNFKSIVMPEETVTALTQFKLDIALEPVYFEEPFAHTLGYGGRCDLIGKCSIGNYDGWCIIDWKTQGTKTGNRVNFWEDWSLQLSAYAHGVANHIGVDGIASAKLISVVVSTKEEGRVEWKVWDNEEDHRWSLFKNVLELWKSPLGTGTDLSFERKRNDEKENSN